MNRRTDECMKGAAEKSKKWEEKNHNIFELFIELSILQDW